jgi:hypothetical protein
VESRRGCERGTMGRWDPPGVSFFFLVRKVKGEEMSWRKGEAGLNEATVALDAIVPFLDGKEPRHRPIL